MGHTSFATPLLSPGYEADVLMTGGMGLYCLLFIREGEPEMGASVHSARRGADVGSAPPGVDLWFLDIIDRCGAMANERKADFEARRASHRPNVPTLGTSFPSQHTTQEANA